MLDKNDKKKKVYCKRNLNKKKHTLIHMSLTTNKQTRAVRWTGLAILSVL
jgi:hypothetical protein